MGNPFADWDDAKVAAHNASVRGQKSSTNAPDQPATPRTEKKAGESTKKGKGPNKTELAYSYVLEMEFVGCLTYFEGLTFRLKNGHRYTPDWVLRIDDDKVMCVEVKARGKNNFRQPSYQRARVMFDQCRVEWPNYVWRWAEKHNGEWTITDY
jgi:hypothetical protein